jgi:hypothetical protein
LLYERGSLLTFASEAETVDWGPVVRETEMIWLEIKL